MNVLRGTKDTIIIDDTYNASPLAGACALRALYKLSVPQRIAVLGSMNELGVTAQAEHERIGRAVPQSADLLVTVGQLAREHLAPAAIAAGLSAEQVQCFGTPIAAGAYLVKLLLHLLNYFQM